MWVLSYFLSRALYLATTTLNATMVTLRRSVLALLTSVCSVSARCNEPVNTSNCKCFPGDECWPTAEEWSDFNATVDGRLIATVPLAAACHDNTWGSYDNVTCMTLRNGWLDPETQYVDQLSQHTINMLIPNSYCRLIVRDGAFFCQPQLRSFH